MTQEEAVKDSHDAPPAIYKLAEAYGSIKKGYTLEDYFIEAVKTGGYETALVWGVQGGGKSSRMLQMGYWIYKDWDVVLDNVIFKPSEFVNRLQSTPKAKRIPCLLWDDIGVHYTSSTFKTDIMQYQAIDAAWAAIRTKCNVIIMTIPLIDRLAKNIKDNITFEVFIGRNQLEAIRRIFHLPGMRGSESGYFKLVVEDIRSFGLYDVPIEVWKKYWDKRLQLTQDALAKLDTTIDKDDMTGYISVMDASEKLDLNPNTIQQMISRGVVEGRKIRGILCMNIEYFDRLYNQKRK